MARSAYHTTLPKVVPHGHPLHSLLVRIPYLTMEQRKACLTIARCQVYPDLANPNQTLGRRLKKTLQTFVACPSDPAPFQLHQLFPNVEITSPVFSAFISMMIRNAPWANLDEVDAEIESAQQKELAAAVDGEHPVTFNWSSIFSPHDVDRSIPIAPGYRSDPALARSIHDSFVRAARSLSLQTFYPDYSYKTIGEEARMNLKIFETLNTFDDRQFYSTAGLEKVYHSIGAELEGPTEMRWAWKYIDLKPRVYYARGPDQYYPSKYIQQVFNTIVDEFPACGRFSRFQTQEIRGKAGETLFIYDYSSFTSRLNEIRNFTTRLAEFLEGLEVQIIDTFLGPVMCDLGKMLHKYNESANMYPEFDSTSSMDPSKGQTLVTHTCGMLGVPGNITSCTLLHTIHLMFVLGHERCKCVGDDAIGWTSGDVDDVWAMLTNIGEISKPKMNSWEPREFEEPYVYSWNYVKRPVDRLQDSIYTQRQAVFPPLNLLDPGYRDSFHTVVPVQGWELRKKIANMLLAFVRQFSDWVLEEDEESLIDRFVRSMVDLSQIANIYAKQAKYYTQDELMRPLVFPRRFRSGEYVSLLEEDYWNTRVVLPEFKIPVTPANEVTTSMEYVGTGSRALRLGRMLGYVETEPVRRAFLVRDDPEYFREFLNRRFASRYRICISRKVPVWLMSLLCDSQPSSVAPYANQASSTDSEDSDWEM